MRAAARDDPARGPRSDPGGDGGGMHHLATGNGDVDWQLLESRWRKGQRIITEHDDVSELPHLDAAEQLFLEPYFPVKRVVFMPPRTCHSVPLFLAAVCGGRERPLASAQWGRAFCGVAQAAPASLHNALRLGAAGVCLTSASVPDPRSPWAAPAGSPRHTSRWPRPPRQV